MFLRDRVPSETSKKIAHGISTVHFAVLVGLSVFYNLACAAHLLVHGASSAWVWLQIAGIVLLAASITALVLSINRVGPFRER